MDELLDRARELKPELAQIAADGGKGLAMLVIGAKPKEGVDIICAGDMEALTDALIGGMQRSYELRLILTAAVTMFEVGNEEED